MGFLTALGRWAAAIALWPMLAITAQTPDGFVPLFDGTSLNGWTVENTTAGNFSVQDGVLRVEGPQGWLRSVDQYADFSLHVEFRFLTDDADSGVFVRAPDPPSNVFIRGWPANAYQIQTRDMSTNRTTNPIWLGNLYRHRVVESGETSFDADAVLGVARGTGEWQEFDIDVVGERVAVQLNGTVVTEADNIVNPTGHIGLQGEAGVVEYRTIAIRVQ